MLKIDFEPISRDEFMQLREARRLVKQEFGADLELHAEDVLDKLFGFALESKSDALFDLFSALKGVPDGPAPERTATSSEAPESDQPQIGGFLRPVPAQATNGGNGKPAPSAPNPAHPQANIRVGDIVDGKRCVGWYRGNPVLKPVDE